MDILNLLDSTLYYNYLCDKKRCSFYSRNFGAPAFVEVKKSGTLKN